MAQPHFSYYPDAEPKTTVDRDNDEYRDTYKDYYKHYSPEKVERKKKIVGSKYITVDEPSPTYPPPVITQVDTNADHGNPAPGSTISGQTYATTGATTKPVLTSKIVGSKLIKSVEEVPIDEPTYTTPHATTIGAVPPELPYTPSRSLPRNVQQVSQERGVTTRTAPLSENRDRTHKYSIPVVAPGGLPPPNPGSKEAVYNEKGEEIPGFFYREPPGRSEVKIVASKPVRQQEESGFMPAQTYHKVPEHDKVKIVGSKYYYPDPSKKPYTGPYVKPVNEDPLWAPVAGGETPAELQSSADVQEPSAIPVPREAVSVPRHHRSAYGESSYLEKEQSLHSIPSGSSL